MSSARTHMDLTAGAFQCSFRSCRPANSDSTELNQTLALSYCLSMISAQTLRVCREGKPVSTFPDHALASAYSIPRKHSPEVTTGLAASHRSPQVSAWTT